MNDCYRVADPHTQKGPNKTASEFTGDSKETGPKAVRVFKETYLRAAKQLLPTLEKPWLKVG